jgi:recombination DNA repair RAD52 pathway protein
MTYANYIFGYNPSNISNQQNKSNQIRKSFSIITNQNLPILRYTVVNKNLGLVDFLLCTW